MRKKFTTTSLLFRKVFWLFLGLICLATVDVSAQKRELKKGIKHYSYNEFSQAIPWFKKTLTIDKEIYTAVKLLANSYRKIRDYENAELYYLLAVNSDSSIAEDHLYYGQVLKANGKLAAAKEQFIKFSNLAENSFLGNIMTQSINEIENWEEVPKEFNTETASKLNSEMNEFGVTVWKDKIYIISDREEHFYSIENSSWSDKPFLSIYEADTSYMTNPEAKGFKIAKGLLNTRYHDGPLTINKGENKIMISRIANEMRGKDFVNRMKLYEGKYEDGKWKEFVPFPYNSDDYSVGHAAFSDSGNVVFFASDMPGGFGGMDLYYSEWLSDGWSKPKNLGPSINTIGNEVFPYAKDSILYFSSDGLSGYGGLDIFSSILGENGWQAPTNLKSPINSTKDDFSIYFVSDSAGFYASNRDGGIGEDDIYSFVQTPPQLEVDLHAVLEYEGLPMEGVKVILLNSNDSIIQIAYTDKDGRMIFDNLPYQEDYFMRLEAADGTELEEGRLFLTDQSGEKLRLLSALQKGVYSFKALPPEEIKLLAQETSDPGILQRFMFKGKVYEKIPEDLGRGVMIYLVNKDGEIIDSTLTDEFGLFSFQSLVPEDSYLLKLQESEPPLNIAFINESNRIFDVAKIAVNSPLLIENQLDASIDTRDATNQGFTTLISRLEYNGIPLSDTRIKIYDHNKKLIGVIYSNEKGEFQFNRLEFDDIYFLELSELSKDSLLETSAYVMNLEGELLYLIPLLENGMFRFQSLPYPEYEKQRQRELKKVPEVVKLAGQVYKKLPGDYDAGVMVYVVSEAGDILDSVVTDNMGRFEFKKLRSDESYSFKVAGEKSNLNLALLDANNTIVDQAIMDENGNFSYKKLTYQVAQFKPLEISDADLLEDEYNQAVSGQVFQKLPGDFGDSLMVYLYDEEGNLVGTTYTDMDGKFEFSKLKGDENYFFKIEHRDENFQLITFNDEDQVQEKIVKNRFGKFKFSKLGMQHHEIFLEEASDHQILHYDNLTIDLSKYTVNYRFDKSNLESAEVKKLESLAKVLKGKDLKIQVISHTDSRGSKAYNQTLSERRTNTVVDYLVSFGLNKNQFVANYYGELRPVIDCEKYDCDNDDHRKNRRTEFKFLDIVEER